MFQLSNHEEILIPKSRRIRNVLPSYKFPSVALLMPFNPKMVSKSTINATLSRVTKEAITQLKFRYPGDMSELVAAKLEAIISNLNFNTHRKSLAVFVSPVFEKTYYLKLRLKEKIIVNQSLRIGDIIDHQIPSPKFHILVLTETRVRLLSPDQGDFIKNEYTRLRDNWLKQIVFLDNTISQLPFIPVILMGNEKLIADYQAISIHKVRIILTISGNFGIDSPECLQRIVEREFCARSHSDNSLSLQISNSISNGTLLTDFENIYEALVRQEGKLLLVSKLFSSGIMPRYDHLNNHNISGVYNRFSNVKNIVDEIIEVAITSGNEVAWVDQKLLGKNSILALISK